MVSNHTDTLSGEKMQRALDSMLKTGHGNAYFPLLYRAFETEEKKNASLRKNVLS
jgi:hypothetical protein